jgi:SOS-response transcriptional repressor LexA
MDFTNNIRLIMDRLGTNQGGLAEKLGLSKGVISEFATGARAPSKEFLLGISKLGISLDWFLTSEGSMFLSEPQKMPAEMEKHPLVVDIETIVKQNIDPIEHRLKAVEDALQRRVLYPSETPDSEFLMELSESEPEYGELRELPFVDDIAAGPPIEQRNSPWETVRVPKSLIKSGVITPCYCARVRGGSMTEANIPDGAVVIIAQSDEPVDGAIQVVRYKNKSTLKRVCRGKNGDWELRFEDGSGAFITVDSGDFEVQGTFLAVVPRDLVMINRD